MFFIGIFGIDQRNKVILTKQNVICPVCGAFGRYSIVKTYSCFHTFFIPLWRWNTRYFVECHCCKKLCALDKDIGDRIEKGEGVEIHKENIHINDYGPNICPGCGTQIEPHFQFCPNCGNKI